jgi:hypothetical protein
MSRSPRPDPAPVRLPSSAFGMCQWCGEFEKKLKRYVDEGDRCNYCDDCAKERGVSEAA